VRAILRAIRCPRQHGIRLRSRRLLQPVMLAEMFVEKAMSAGLEAERAKEGFWVACHDCDMLSEVRGVPDGFDARCPRCGALLYFRRDNSIANTLALVVAGLILMVPANVYPIMTLKVLGSALSSTLFHAVWALYQEGLRMVAGLVLMSSIVVPLLELVLLLYILLPLSMGKRASGSIGAFRAVRKISEWGMLEVYMLGILVAIIKLKDLADLEMGLGIYSFVALLFVTVLTSISLDAREVWDRLEA